MSEGWPDIAPGTEGYYEQSAGHYMVCAEEKIDEWDYQADKHGYCHDRPILVGLLREIERLRENQR